MNRILQRALRSQVWMTALALATLTACGHRSSDSAYAAGSGSEHGQVLRFHGKHAGGTLSVVLLANSRQLLSSGGDGIARIWDVATGREIQHFSGQRYHFAEIAETPHGLTVFTPGPDPALHFWAVASGKEIRSFMGSKAPLQRVAISSDGALAAAGGDGSEIHIWETATGRQVRQLAVKSAVIRLGFVAGSSDVVSIEAEGRLCRWPTEETPPVCFAAATEPISQAAFTADGKIALVGTRFGKLELWEVASQKSLGKLETDGADVVSMALSPEGTHALLGCADKTVRLWNMSTRSEMDHVAGSGSYISCVAFSQDESLAAFGSDSGEVALWRIR